jgi:integrase
MRALHLAGSLGFADKWLEDVRPADFAAWRDRQLLGVKSSTVNRDLNLISGILTRCVKEWGWLHKSPLTNFKRPKDPSPRSRVISWREVRAILRALNWKPAKPETLQQEVGFAFLLALHTGMRAGEVISFERRGTVAHLPFTKNGDPRDVPLSARALRLVELCHPFTVSASSLDALFRKARRNAGLEGFTFHDSRATALTRMSKHVDVLTLARISGHRDIATLARVYYRVTPEQIAAKLR